MADQLRYDALGGWTPNINKLKAKGVSFNRTYCASPLCVPSRRAFFTSLYPNETGSLTKGLEATERQHGRSRRASRTCTKYWKRSGIAGKPASSTS